MFVEPQILTDFMSTTIPFINDSGLG